MVIIMVVSALFSVAIFQVLSREVHRFTNLQEQRWELSQQSQGSSTMSPRYLHVLVPRPDPELEADLLQRIKVLLVIINGLVLIASGVLAYLLAGKTLEPIQDMMEEQQQFVSDAGHELKTPLTAVRTGMEVALRDKKLSLSEAKQVLRDSLEELLLLQNITQSLLNLSQGGPQQEPYFEEIQISQVIQKAIKKVTPMAQRKEISIVAQLESVLVKGIEIQLTELFVTLLDNAIKYSPPKTTIEVATKQGRRSVTVFVKDQGVGITPEDQKHIFDRFFQVDPARSKGSECGHGLGLAIAQRIVGTHHGKLSVQSELGQGSTFVVQLPR